MLKNFYRLLALFSILSIILAGGAAPARASDWRGKVDPWVLQTAAQGDTEFLVFLTIQADLSAAHDLPTKLDKGRYVYQTLTSTAENTQAPLISYLQNLGLAYRPFWIANMLWVRGGIADIQLLAARSDVAHLYANPSVKLDSPMVDPQANTAPEAVEWNITKVNAPAVWALGYTGQGVVIGGQDTGYQWDHPALISHYRGWTTLKVNHDYNWFDATAAPSPTPVDPFGHGTHTMGTMVGDDGGTNKIGMAPGARWIGCRNMDANGAGTPATYSACYQWFVAPTTVSGTLPRPDLAPDVINNSWGCPPTEGCTDPNVLLTVVQNLVAAGIVSAHSAGNSGSGCSTVSDPAAIYDASFTVGATDVNDLIASFSSRGPVTVDGSGRPKPDISAPGVNIRSSVPGGGYQGGWNGTSMAAPHVAGAVALLISARPSLRGQVDLIETTIAQTAVDRPWTGCSSTGVPNNAYGWGRIDALAAVEAHHQLELSKLAWQTTVLPGDLITYTLAVTHTNGIGATTNVILTDTLPAGTTFVSATTPFSISDDTVQWAFSTLPELQARHVNLSVRVNKTSTGTITNADYAVHSDQVAQIQGDPLTIPIDTPNILELSKSASSASIFPGDLLTYTLIVSNTHETHPAPNVILTDTLPVHTVFVSATGPFSQIGDDVSWHFPSLSALASHTVQLVVRADLAAMGSITNSNYTVRSDVSAPLSGALVITPLDKLDILDLTQVAWSSIAYPGGIQGYTLQIRNNHDSLTATNLVLTDTLPLHTSIISATLPWVQTDRLIRWDIPSLAPLQTIAVELTVRIDLSAVGLLTNFDYAVYSDQAAFVRGEPLSTPLGRVYFLPVAIKVP